MTTLRRALQQLTWRQLKAIGRRRGLRFASNIGKAALVERLHRHLLAAVVRPHLPAPQQRILERVAAAGGQLSERHLFLSLAPAPADVKALLALGLLFKGGDELLFIPTELMLQAAPPSSSATQPPRIAGEMVCHDVTCLLALLHRDDVKLLHGRWLPPRFLKQWGQLCRIPPARPQARSELQTHRRRFLHYLAEGAGLVTGFTPPVVRPSSSVSGKKTNDGGRTTTDNNIILPAPAAWLWLRAPGPERIQALWEAWQRPDPDRWRRFRLPGYKWLTNPAALLEPVQQAWLSLNPANPALLARTLLEQQPRLLDLLPPATIDPAETLVETISNIIAGPLSWLGILKTQTSGTQGTHRNLPRQFPSVPTSSSELFDDAPPTAKFALQSHIRPNPLKSTFTLTPLPGLPDPVDLMTAIEVGRLKSELKPHTRSTVDALLPTPDSLLLTSSSFILSLHRGWSPPALLAAINRLAERPLTGPEVEHLQAWAAAAQNVTLKQVVLLESIEPQVITRLASNRRGRNLIHRTLSPRAVVVDPAKLPQLVKRLTEQEGVPPKDEGGRMKDEDIPPSSFIPSASSEQALHPSYLWLAVNVYQALGRFINLPGRIPQAVIDHLTPALTPADMAAVEVMVDKTVAALRRLIEGRTPFPPWSSDSHPEEKSLAVIEQALAAGQPVELLYYAAGTDRLTRRIVEPYRVEWRGGGAGEGKQSEIVNRKRVLSGAQRAQVEVSKIGYLIGFCRRAQAERVFRLDRIKDIALVPPGESVV